MTKQIYEIWDKVVLMGGFYTGDCDNKTIGTFGLGGCECIYAELDYGRIFLSHFSPIKKIEHLDSLKILYCINDRDGSLVTNVKKVILLYPEKWEKINGKYEIVDKNEFMEKVIGLGMFGDAIIKKIQYSTSIPFDNDYHGYFWVKNGIPYHEGIPINFNKGE